MLYNVFSCVLITSPSVSCRVRGVISLSCAVAWEKERNKEIEKKMPAIMSTDDTPLAEKKVVAKFFTPDSNWIWFVFEGNKQPDGDWEFFGMVHGMYNEMGSFMLSELEATTGPMGLHIERDRHIGDMVYGHDSR